ncbi:MAG: hypothetical protein FJ044_01865 [Candidatus Cloacimonetes bacterium]|nr:hypothetical protein [Candidatus Cloacimonadota bacterium]
MRKIIFHFSFFIAFSFSVLQFFSSSASPTYAADFTTDYQVTYDVSLNGTAKITQEITLINNTANLYPADFSLTVKGGQIENVAASDELGQMKAEISAIKSESVIKVSFNKHAVGQGSKIAWTLSYDVPDFAVRRGRIWELTVPKIAPASDIGSYKITLKVPKSFGPEHFVSPQPSATGGSTEHTDSHWIYNFNCLPPATYHQPVSASFGDFQLFSFKLLYHLQNPESFAATTEIALLPDVSPYQRIYYQSLEPKPQRIYQDGDGNYLAEYKLAAKERLDITFAGMARVVGNVVDVVDVVDVGKQVPQLPQATPPIRRGRATTRPPQAAVTTFEPYLLPAKYWEVNAEEIRNLLEEIKKADSAYALNPNPYILSKAIYDYVTTNLKYDPTRISQEAERLGAVKSLGRKDSAVCMEFTDLLVTLMRAAGIPAREIDGYAYTSEDEKKAVTSDTLHSWVQIHPVRKEDEISNGVKFPDYGWINIDPTWGATTGIDYFSKLDTNHLAFVIKGLDSEKPYPAGSYKIEGSEEGDVKVTFAENFAHRIGGFAGNAVPFRLWWENWERENQKIDWLTAFFRFLARVF